MCTSSALLEDLAGLMGCKVGSPPAFFLELPLCTGVASQGMWSLVIKRLRGS